MNTYDPQVHNLLAAPATCLWILFFSTLNMRWELFWSDLLSHVLHQHPANMLMTIDMRVSDFWIQIFRYSILLNLCEATLLIWEQLVASTIYFSSSPLFSILFLFDFCLLRLTVGWFIKIILCGYFYIISPTFWKIFFWVNFLKLIQETNHLNFF